VAIPFLFVAVLPVQAVRSDITAPSLISPSNAGSVAMPATLTWSEVQFSVSLRKEYLVEFKQSGAAPVSAWVSISTNSYTIPAVFQQEVVAYEWRVRACDTSIRRPDSPENQEILCGPWSSQGEFWKFTASSAWPYGRNDISAPTSPSPFVGQLAPLPVTLSWNASNFQITGTTQEYILEFGLEGSDINNEAILKSSTPSFTPTVDMKAGSNYLWRVRGCYANIVPTPKTNDEKCGPWSSGGIFWKFTATLAKPGLLSPQNNAAAFLELSPDSLISLKVAWNEVKGASAYRVTVTKTAGSTPYLTVQQNTDKTFLWLSVELLASYTWKVTPIYSGVEGPVSDTWAFKVFLASPTPVSPVINANVVDPIKEFKWSQVYGANSYILQIFGPDNKPAGLKIVSGTAYEVPEGERDFFKQFGVPYTWKVYACQTNIGTNCGTPGGPWNFTIVPSDTIWPKIISFTATPTLVNSTSPNTVISWEVSDSGGLGLKQIEVWRAFDDNPKNNFPNAEEWGPIFTYTGPFDTVNSDSGTYTDKSLATDGTYWYGIHAVDKNPNCITEQARDCITEKNPADGVLRTQFFPIKVQVDKTSVIDKTAPTITNVSSDKPNGSYTIGAVIDIDVTFSEAVTSTGNVTVALETGTTDRTCTFTVSAATTGTCNYTVQARDTSPDLIVSTISGIIKDMALNAMTNFVPATNLAANKAIVVDTVAPPEPTCKPGNITFNKSISVNCSNSEARVTMRNTTDGTIPVADSTDYLTYFRFITTTTLKIAAWDAAGNRSDVQTYTYTLINNPPVAKDDTPSRHAQEETSFTIQYSFLLFDDIDQDDDLLTVSSLASPSNGTVVENAEKTAVIYTSSRNFFGTDSFQYTISDGRGGTDTATVTIIVDNVNDTPVASNFTFQRMQYQTPLIIDVSASDPDGGTLTVNTPTIKSGPGAVAVAPDRPLAVLYTLTDDEAKLMTEATIEYTVTDESGAKSAPGNITIQAVPPGTPGSCAKYCVTLDRAHLPSGTAVCICNPLTTMKFTDVVNRILNIIFFISIAVAPVMIIVAGFKFLTGGGDPKVLASARQMLIWTGIGFGIILLSKGIVVILRGVIGF